MTTILALNGTDAEHLEEVVAEMREMGAPEIRAIWNGSEWLSLHGSHRLAACEILGLEPVIVEMSESDAVPFDICDNCSADAYETIGEFLEFEVRHGWQGTVHQF